MNSRKNKMFFIFTFIFLSIVNLKAQYDTCNKNNAYQEYNYKDSNIILNLRANGIHFCSIDTIEFEISIHNKSSNSIYLFKDYSEGYASLNKINNTIYLDMGGHFVGGIESILDMNELKPDSMFNIFKKYPVTQLTKHNFSKTAYIYFGLGYIPNIALIKNYTERDQKKYFLEINKNSISIDSFLVEEFIKIVDNAELLIQLSY